MAFALRDIEHFLSVARTGDFSQAAHLHGVSVIALVKSIRRVERAFGLKLLERNARGARVTEVGTRFMEAAQRLNAARADVARLTTEIREGQSGVLRIAFSDPICAIWMSTAITDLMKTQPEVRVSCRLGLSQASLLQAVQSGEIDLAVASTDGMPSVDCDYFLLHMDPMLTIVHEDHPLAQKTSLSLQDLLPYRWSVAFSSPAIFQTLRAAFENANLPMPDIAVQADQPTEFSLTFARRSNFVALVPRSQWLLIMPPDLRVLQLPTLAASRFVYLLTRMNAPSSPAIDRLKEALITQATAWGADADHDPLQEEAPRTSR